MIKSEILRYGTLWIWYIYGYIKCVFYGRNEEVVVLKCWRKESKPNNKHPVSVK